MAYVVYGIGFLWMLWIVGKRIVQGKKKERRRMIIQGLCLGELLFFVGYDMVRYLQCETVDSARLSRYALPGLYRDHALHCISEFRSPDAFR